MKVLVLGGRGFIGRHAVASLEAAGASVVVGTRKPQRVDNTNAAEEHVLHQTLSLDNWIHVTNQYDVVLNCVGILRQRWGETYAAVHHHAPGLIAQACCQTDTRFVHVSALGLSATARSRFITSKFRGEQAIQSAGGDWIIARLSLLDGEGGYGASWLRGVSQLPVFVVPTSAKGNIAALTAEDAGEALCRLCVRSEQALQLHTLRIFELGGEQPVAFEHYIRGLRKRYSDKPAIALRMPGFLARIGAHICDVLHFSPFSFGHWELLCGDNVPVPNRLPQLLERDPEKVFDHA
ncbi:MAG: NAD(P)H-binding protein [Pseudomonadota bacterium]